MPLPSTMTPIATTTLTGNQQSITFSSIPNTYTDLVISLVSVTTGSNYLTAIQFNTDNALPVSGTNYSATWIYGNGTSAASSRQSSAGHSILENQGNNSTNPNQFIINIMSYANTNTYKTVLTRNANATAVTYATVGLWRNTAAINQFTLIPDTTTGRNYFTTGTTITLYGIKAA